MSVSINVSGMTYNGLTCAQRAEVDQSRKSRIAQVRQQSKEFAQQVREKVQSEKENQLRKLQAIKQRELNEWKRRTQCEIQQQYSECLSNFGAAHIAACEASCEEDEPLQQRREEYDLMAAQRGRSAMLQEQRKRDREAEDRLAKRKRRLQRNASVQADIVSNREFGTNVDNLDDGEISEDEEPAVRVETFTNKRNLHINSSTQYDPKKYSCNSVDSSNNCDSEEHEESSGDMESELEFNQITNLLKQRSSGRFEPAQETKVVIELPSSSDEEEEVVQPVPPKKSLKLPPQQKSILKKTLSPKKKLKVKPPAKTPQPDQNRVKYVDLRNKYTTSYIPDDNLVTQNQQTSRPNARTEAKRHEESSKMPSENVLRQLAEIRHKEALEKEKTRRDYERLRLELDEIAKEEKQAKEAAGKALRKITTSQLEKHEQARQAKMNKAVENALRRNIITCPPVDSNVEKSDKEKSCENNVGGGSSTASSGRPENKLSKPKSEIDNLVKVERLKDLLERINHQKKLLLKEIEKSDDIPGPDLEKVMKCLEKLEKEKSALDSQPNDDGSQKKADELQAREQKLNEREKRLENGIRQLYKSQKVQVAPESVETESISSSDATSGVPPVEIIIRVQPKSGVKVRKSIRCIDTLIREPGRVYPKTPKKSKKPSPDVEEPKKVEPEKTQQQTQTSPATSDAPKPILKKPESSKPSTSTIKQVTHPTTFIRRPSDDSSSTTYQSLPERIYLDSSANVTADSTRKPHHKLNPALMHYITRLLGMNQNIGNQLSVSASTVSTPGSSTINTSGNNASNSDAQGPSFDDNRLKRLQEFINDNYSFLSEINETLERSHSQERNEESIARVDGIWRDVLCKKKPSRQVPLKPAKDVAPPPPTKQVEQTFKKPQPPARPPAPKTSSSRASSASQPQRPQQTHQRQVPEQSQKPRTTAPPPRPPITSKDMLNVTKYLESHMLNNFTEYTANCQKRIGELAQMMEKVRQEKQKLIENSLSSGEFGHYTEYREIAMPGKVQDAPTTSASDLKDSPSQREDPPSEEINNILQKQTRPFGVSKDSGISILSRPVTSSDFRDSPDARVTSEERENTFQPILKDIPKPPRVKLTPADGISGETLNISQLIREQEERAQRKLKPPLSLNRFSPLEKPHEPHELSTIAEVETPSASKVNLLDKVTEDVDRVEPFPSFSEYAKNLVANPQHSMDTSLTTLVDIRNALEDMKLKSFTAPVDYGIREISHEVECQSSSNDSSLVDIVEEMKRRKIITEPFKYRDENVEDVDHTTPTAIHQVVLPQSPKRKPPQSRILLKTPEPKDDQREEVKTPTKRRPLVEPPPPPESHGSNDTLSGIQEIEKESALDLKGMGLNWAASMMKRGGESKKLESSSSSSSVEKGASIAIEIDIDHTSTSDRSSSSNTSGRPLNLREFLARELTRRSQAAGDKSLSDESSLSSQFMRSLLNATGRSSSASKSQSDEKLRTSTPVRNSLTLKSGNTQLFTGDSLSTLKGSEGDGSGRSDKSNEQRKST